MKAFWHKNAKNYPQNVYIALDKVPFFNQKVLIKAGIINR